MGCPTRNHSIIFQKTPCPETQIDFLCGSIYPVLLLIRHRHGQYLLSCTMSELTGLISGTHAKAKEKIWSLVGTATGGTKKPRRPIFTAN